MNLTPQQAARYQGGIIKNLRGTLFRKNTVPLKPPTKTLVGFEHNSPVLASLWLAYLLDVWMTAKSW